MADSSRPITFSRDLAHCDPRIQAAWPQICQSYATMFQGRYLKITCTYRSSMVQGALWYQGRANLATVNEMRTRASLAPITKAENHKVTWTHTSKHTVFPSLALDFAVVLDPDGPSGPIKPVIEWDSKQYLPMIAIARGMGLQSGAEFRPYPDSCHIQVPDVGMEER